MGRQQGWPPVRAALCTGADGLFVDPSPPPTLQIPAAGEASTLQSTGLKTCQTSNMLLSTTKEHEAVLLPAQIHTLFLKGKF